MSRKIDTAIETILAKQQSAQVGDVTRHVESVTGMSLGPANRKAHEFYQRRLQHHLHLASVQRKKLAAAAKKAAKAKAGPGPGKQPTPTPKGRTRKATTRASVGLGMPLQRRRALAKNRAQPPFTIIRSTALWREIQGMHLADLESAQFKVYWQK